MVAHFLVDMRLVWWLYRVLARTALSPQETKAFYLPLNTREERMRLIEELMADHPGHWGRFAAYVMWSSQHYPDERAYQYYREIRDAVPDLVPTLPRFALGCLGNLLYKMTVGPCYALVQELTS